MLKIYGMKLCPDCVETMEILEKNKIKYEFVEITETTANLKEFLVLRDKMDEFGEVKKEGKIGIPCFVNQGEITLDLEAVLNKIKN